MFGTRLWVQDGGLLYPHTIFFFACVCYIQWYGLITKEATSVDVSNSETISGIPCFEPSTHDTADIYPIHTNLHGCFQNRGTPKWMVYNENPIKMDDLGVRLFLETPTYRFDMQHYQLPTLHTGGLNSALRSCERGSCWALAIGLLSSANMMDVASLVAVCGATCNGWISKKCQEATQVGRKIYNRWHLVTLPDFENLKSAENAMNQGSTTIETTPPWNLHFRTWKWMVGILVFFWGSAYFEWQGVYPKNPTILLGSLNLRLVLRRPSQKFPSCFSAPKFWAWLLRKRQPFFDSSWQPPGK